MSTRILLVGAGAIGAFFASRLATVPNVLVSALCRSNYHIAKAKGLRISSPYYGEYTFKPEHVFGSPDEARKAKREKRLQWDYLLVATKALPDVSDDSILLEGLLGSSSCIILIQNGIAIEEPYQKRFPHNPILSGVTIASCAQPSPGLIKHNRWTKIDIGPYLPKNTPVPSAADAASTLVALLTLSGIRDATAHPPKLLQWIRWHKLAINATMNPSAVLSNGAGNREMALDSELREHVTGVMREVLSLALLEMDEPVVPAWLATPEQVLRSVERNLSGSRPSMWQDWVAGRRMEVEVILGNVVRMARGRGMEVPRCQGMYALLRKAQERREEEKGRM